MSLAYREIRRKVPLNELNLFSATSVASVEYNLERVRGSKYINTRTEILEWLVKASKEQAKQLCEEARRRFYRTAEAYRLAGYRLLSTEGEFIEARLSSHGLFGGRSFGYTLFEVGLEFDPLLNLPMIPGSSIKGALNSAWEALELQGGKELIFGRKEGVGGCVFCDALPIEPNHDGFILYPDVITPHYPNDILEETKEPTPIAYISVAPGVKFGFIIAVDRTISSNILDKLKRAFLFAFSMGLGSKTSVGYGVFTITSFNIQLG
jgi:CRISPR/Cas system CMR subunit Cmr6 (Cas7 group RAMP superfamily)